MKVYNAFLMPFDSLKSKYPDNANMLKVGGAVSNWKDNTEEYQKIQGILIDVKTLMLSLIHIYIDIVVGGPPCQGFRVYFFYNFNITLIQIISRIIYQSLSVSHTKSLTWWSTNNNINVPA